MAINIPAAPTSRAAKSSSRTFYTVADLAARWAMSRRHIYRLIAEGRLNVHKIGRSVRVSASDVALFEAGCRGVL